MEKSTCRPLNMEKIKNKKIVFLSTNEALKGVILIEWDADVLNGNKQAILVERNNY